MLVAFEVENFRSYRDKQTLSLLAGGGEDLLGNTFRPSVPALRGRRILRAAAIYGANASGKSNLVKAYDSLCDIVSRSAKESTADDELPVVPFGLDEEWAKQPTCFSATVIVDSVLYIYTVELSSKRIHKEELTAFPKTHPQRLFSRTVDDDGNSSWQFSRANFKRDVVLEARTRMNSLYLSVGALFNHPVLTAISSFFTARSDIRQPRFASDELGLALANCAKDPDFRQWAGKLLDAADTGITAIRSKVVDVFSTMPESVKRTIPDDLLPQVEKDLRQHPQVDISHGGKGGKDYWWPLSRESDGTQQLLSLLRSWYNLVRKDTLVMVDELDDSLHPLISRRLLEMVNDPSANTSRGQLVFTTHDTTLLDSSLLRRDQVFFTEKTREGNTKLYSLLEYTPRKDEALQKGYLAGRYGAIPFMGELTFV